MRDGLLALATSNLDGNIKGRENEIRFAWELHHAGVVNIIRPDADVSDMGRKWRAALSQLGFIYPELPTRAGIAQEELGRPFIITPNGRRLVEAESVSGIQECFLRSLAAYYIPSVLEPNYTYNLFSPLRHTLAVLLELERRTGESRLNFQEMALYVQLTATEAPTVEIVDQILTFRAARSEAQNKRRFDQDSYNAAGVEHQYAPGTFRDYADTNFRYLKATGLVQSKGRGIAIVPEKHVFVEQLVADIALPDNDLRLVSSLCNGATLPTDNRDTARIVLYDLVAQVNRRGVQFNITGRTVDTAADIAIVRHEAEDILSRMNEEEYANRQGEEWHEIAEYMDLLINPRRRRGGDDDEEAIAIPQAEAPAYFEWTLWRAFLAIDSLMNRPYEARRFKIDQDFLPIGPAPGGGPDLLFEFEDFVVVVEVTLTENSRQEAAEGEPVRRHVADEVVRYAAQNKPVYGLFLAKKIDSNTAETFRIGVWYDRDDNRMGLDIIPLTIAQFKTLFEAMFRSGNVRVAEIRELLNICTGFRPDLHAPEWKAEIDRTVLARAAVLTA
ncbi:AlwI family type II restriction endonuclease [Geobacter metallireducens]|uniref:AlwI family type II restriction endonuclease n=1 Tax=Geobacter metallireducens TaxID=28232 RepID=UPI001930B6FE|nr:AlwI family type II restriction endonuclease [Geobacter metallireducens]